MYKIFFAGVRRPELSPEEFRTHWSSTHADLVQAIPGLQRYVINFVPEHAKTSLFPFDGFAEVSYESREAFQAQLGSEAVRLVIEDEPKLFDLERCVRLRVDEHLIRR